MHFKPHSILTGILYKLSFNFHFDFLTNYDRGYFRVFGMSCISNGNQRKEIWLYFNAKMDKMEKIVLGAKQFKLNWCPKQCTSNANQVDEIEVKAPRGP